MTDTKKPGAARVVSPRSWALASGLAAVSALGVTAPLATPALAQATPAAPAAESGEAGEAGMQVQDPAIEYLAKLGLFEASYRIAVALYGTGAHAEAAAHLETSHHAFYDDIADDIAAHGARPFGDKARALTQAIANGDSDEVVTELATALFSAIAAAADAAHPTPGERIMAMHELMDVAAADYKGGVENGKVIEPHEYRDAWGFVETVRARALRLAASDKPDVAQAGRDVLEQVNMLAPLFPSVDATTTEGDPADIAAASAWIEIIALRLR